MNSHYLGSVNFVFKGWVRREAYDRMETGECSAHSEPAESGLGDGAVYDPLLAEAIEKTLCDFVSAGMRSSAGGSSIASA
jgi:hypothetical protein